MISKIQNKLFFNNSFKNLFNRYNTDLKAMYTLPYLVTYKIYTQSFQNKILNNALFLNEKFHTFGIKPSQLCCFCNLYGETPFHLICECNLILIFQFIFYLCSSSMCINLENKVHKFKKSHNKNLKSKKNRKRTCWKTTALLKKWHIINNIIPKCRWILLTKTIFEI